MKLTKAFPVFLLAVAMPVFAHPHFFKEVRFAFDRDADSKQAITLSHITVPFNEIAAGSLAEGESWHLGFAQFKTGTDLSLGGSEVKAGEYALKVKRGVGEDWSLFLEPKGEKDEAKSIPLAGEMSSNPEGKDHLMIEILPVGEKEETGIVLEVRFGPSVIQVPLSLGN